MKKVVLVSTFGLSLTGVTGIIAFLQPSPVTVAAVISLIFVVVLSLGLIFLPFSRAVLAGLFTLGFFALNITVGFEIINTMLLICIIIGLDRLLSS